MARFRNVKIHAAAPWMGPVSVDVVTLREQAGNASSGVLALPKQECAEGGCPCRQNSGLSPRAFRLVTLRVSWPRQS